MRNKIFAVGALLGALSAFSPAYAEGEAGLKAEYLGPFQSFVHTKAHPSFTYTETLVVGAELPATGVTYYTVPAEFGPTPLRYTVVNKRAVLVDAGTRRVVQIIP